MACFAAADGVQDWQGPTMPWQGILVEGLARIIATLPPNEASPAGAQVAGPIIERMQALIPHAKGVPQH